MSIFDGLRSFLTIGEPPPASAALQTRSLEQMVIAVTGYDPAAQPWRRATGRQAMGVPAVFKALTLISNTIGTLSLEGFRSGVKLENFDTPPLIKRPDPFTAPHVFWRDSAFNKAYHGEHWWWIGKRDGDDKALALINVDPREITVERNPRNSLRPIIRWNNEEMRNDDMVQSMYARDPDNPLRGIGPLQACRAAVSVAVEAQEWAANWFAGAPSQTIIKSAEEVDATEAGLIKDAWMAGAGNLPKVIDPGIESIQEIGGDPERAQLSQSRLHQNGEVALMYSMPPSLLNFAISGSQITYQNVGQVSDDLARQCLLPHYLEPMEQLMADLLPRTTTCEFNIKRLLRPDIRTRYDTYATGLDKQFLTIEEVRAAEGLAPGDVETRPIPFAPPAAIPTSLPVQLRSVGSEVRCGSCDRLLAEMASPPYRFTCRCKVVTSADGAFEERGSDLAPLITALITRERDQPPIVVQPTDLTGVEAVLVQIHTFMLQERAEREPPVVNVTLPAMTVNPEINITVPPGEPPVVNVTMPEVNVATPEVTVNPASVHLPEPMRTRRRVERDDRGLITFVHDEPVTEAS